MKNNPFIIWDNSQNAAIILDIAYIKTIVAERYGRLQSAEEPTAEYVTDAEPENYSFSIKQCFKFYLN